MTRRRPNSGTNSDTKLRHQTPTPDSGTKLRHQTPTPDSGTELRHRTPTPDSGTELRHRTPAPDSGTELRHRTPTPDSGTELRHRTPAPNSGTELRHQTPAPGQGPRWLLLAHQLPTRSSNGRVKTWRRLQQLGAVPTRNSVYVLPNTDQCREDFEWIRSEIVALGGEATVFAADALNQDGSDDIIAAFQRARDADYQTLTRDIERLGRQARAPRIAASRHDLVSRTLRQLRERWDAVQRVDFFHAPAGRPIEDAIAAVEHRLAGRPPRDKEDVVRASAKDFVKRHWVTRPRPGVDRMASAWLIRRFIDPHATFGFADKPAVADVPFDMYTGQFSHEGTSCTFEVLVQRFGITDASVRRLAQIVHDLDMKDTRYNTPEAPAVERMVDGLRQVHADDGALLEQGIQMFEALARSFESAAPPRKRRKR
jgi:hypothetical protein